MTALDTDVLSDLFHGNPDVLARASAISVVDQFVPVIGIDDVLLGRLAAVRHAEAGRGRIDLPRAYDLLQRTIWFLRGFQILSYTSAAHALFRQWRPAKIRVGSQDLRIAAICVDQGVTLATRNARDYSQIPGQSLTVWN